MLVSMHEMSLAVSLLDIIKQEMEKHGKTRLIRITVCHGTLANVVPEALSMAFEVMTLGTPFEGAAITLKQLPLHLACGGCGKEYTPESSHAAVFAPCPFCGEEIGHTVLAGKELYIDQIEVE